MFAKRVFVCLVRLPKKVCGTVPAAAAKYALSAERKKEREGRVGHVTIVKHRGGGATGATSWSR